MSHIDVHDVAQHARARLGRRNQVAALLPAPPRPSFDPWQSPATMWHFNREPYHHPNLPHAGAAALDLELPRDRAARELLPPPAGAEPAPPRATTARASTRAAIAGGVPETLSWSWILNTPATGNPAWATTDVIPWPFRITGFSVDCISPGAGRFYGLQIVATDAPFNGAFATVPGAPLIPIVGSTAGLQPAVTFGITLQAHDQAAGTAILEARHISTAVLGRSVLDLNKRLAIGIRGSVTGAEFFSGHITVERLGDLPLYEPRPFTPRPIPAPTPPRKAPAPAARRVPEPAPVQYAGHAASQPTRQLYWIGTQPRMRITGAHGELLADAPLGSPELTQYAGEAAAAGIPQWQQGAAVVAARGATAVAHLPRY